MSETTNFIVIVGTTAVGKTQIMNRLSNSEYLSFDPATIGFETSF